MEENDHFEQYTRCDEERRYSHGDAAVSRTGVRVAREIGELKADVFAARRIVYRSHSVEWDHAVVNADYGGPLPFPGRSFGLVNVVVVEVVVVDDEGVAAALRPKALARVFRSA